MCHHEICVALFSFRENKGLTTAAINLVVPKYKSWFDTTFIIGVTKSDVGKSHDKMNLIPKDGCYVECMNDLLGFQNEIQPGIVNQLFNTKGLEQKRMISFEELQPQNTDRILLNLPKLFANKYGPVKFAQAEVDPI